jgi:hypothetical protein
MPRITTKIPGGYDTEVVINTDNGTASIISDGNSIILTLDAEVIPVCTALIEGYKQHLEALTNTKKGKPQ